MFLSNAMRRFWICVTILFIVSATHADTRNLDPKGSYAVVISDKAYGESGWRKAAEILQKKYNGNIITYAEDVRDTVMDLQKELPNYCCFVAMPEEAGREFVITVHRMMRRLDSDPYCDSVWGILTGYTDDDAIRIAETGDPLFITRGLSATGFFPASLFETGKKISEDHRGKMETSTPEKGTVWQECSTDNTKIVVNALNDENIQFFATSGHATTKDWQMGYIEPNGQIRCDNGKLYGIDTNGKKYRIRSETPKIYVPEGNCLMGHIPERDCMALAWMHSGGVNQMIGYTVTTWFGYMGRGTAMYLTSPAGRYSLSDAFFFNSQSLLAKLQIDYPQFAEVEFNFYEDPGILGYLAERNGLLQVNEKGEASILQEPTGLLWDRDTVAFYGDPAWQARIGKGYDLPWKENIEFDGRRYRITLETTKEGTWPARPIGIYLPIRVTPLKIEKGQEANPVVTDFFVLIHREGKFSAGERYELVFTAKQLPARDPAIMLERMIMKKILRSAPEDLRDETEKNLIKAGTNRSELISAMTEIENEYLPGMSFLIANMPYDDLISLSKSFLLENTRLAYKAWKRCPWSKQIPEQQFLQYILPYAHLNERRDNWREDFMTRFGPSAWKHESLSDALKEINDTISAELNVTYSATNRPKADQSPYESMEAHFASCTGLSILLADACRSVGIPARIAGVPLWLDESGNHNWVEVFDQRWFNVGSSGSDPRDPDWVNEKCRTNCVPGKPQHSVYSAVTRKTDLYFPLVWDPGLTYVPALDITRFYTNPKETRIKIPGKEEALVTVYWKDEIVARLKGREKVLVTLADKEKYLVEIKTADGKLKRSKLKL